MVNRNIVPALVWFLAVACVGAQEGQASEQDVNPEAEGEAPATEDSFNPLDHTDWGSYYDPQNIFCGKYDCYAILGFDYEEFGSIRPSTKEITKRYRSLSRAWHPDKSKHKDAKERFVKIARAYEVLTKKQQRVEYDFMRYNQEAYFQKYGASVLWNYAPQSDATMIILVLLLAINWFSWIAQKTRWQNVADRLVKAAVEDWSPSMGGSDESKQLKDKALVILKEKEVANGNNDDEASSTTADKKTGKGKVKKEKGQVKVSGKEKKKLEQDALRPIVTELVSEIDDFGAGFHKPTWRDLFLVKLSKFPYHLATGLAWQAKYSIRRLQKKELTDEERNVLTERAVGNVGWDLASDDERKEMVKRKLWIKDNLIEWKDEQEFQKLSKADQKYYKKMKQKGVSKDHTE